VLYWGRYSYYNSNLCHDSMSRLRYWNLTVDELEKSTYDENKVLNWEIKCTIKETEFFGVFCYKNGTPFDYESIKGIIFYYNNISKNKLPEITKFLKNKFGGTVREKGSRVFLENSKVIFSAKDISNLSKELENKFECGTDLSVEFQDLSLEEQEKSELPATKILPIPGK